MVLPDSRGVSRVPRYLGAGLGVFHLSPTGLLPSTAGLSRPLRLDESFLTPRRSCNPATAGPSTPTAQRLQAYIQLVWALPRSLAATWRISNDFSSSGYLDVSVHPVPSTHPIDSDAGTWALPQVGCPIRISPDQRLLAAPRSFSQLTTSFIGSQRQGIHRAPLVA